MNYKSAFHPSKFTRKKLLRTAILFTAHTEVQNEGIKIGTLR
jgi:hypothetical protein